MAWEMLKAAVDAAGLVDPTPISDEIGAAMSLAEGDVVGAGLSMLPYVGEALGKTAKGARAAKVISGIAALD